MGHDEGGSGRLFFNGLIWQWEEDQGSATGLGVKGKAERGWFTTDENGRFSAVGRGDPPPGLRSSMMEAEEDLEGRLVLPGLMDAHIHVGYMGECAEYAQLSGCQSIAELQARLRAHCEQHPAKKWIVGVGWDQSAWGRYPTRQDLDEVEACRPMVLYRACWHIVVANSEAMRRAAVPLQAGEHQVEGGSIDVEAATRVPTGILREAAAPLVTSLITEEDQAVRRQQFSSALRRCVSKGLTAVQTNDERAWDLYKALQDDGELPLRVFLTINHSEMEEVVARGSGPLSGARSGPLLSCQRVKLFSDGSLGAETAALRQPYVGTANTGVLIHPADGLLDKVAAAHGHGYQLEVHAIGDRAVELVLDTLERAGATGDTHRPLVTHCQVLGADLIDRMAALGAVANIQPSFVGTDSHWVRDRIAPDVQQTSYCWRTLMERGIHCAGGSDAPIEDCDALVGMHDAMHRLPHAFKLRPQAGPPPSESDAFLPHERLTFAEALWLYTIGAAYACKAESELGQIRPGFLADFVVLSEDVTESAAQPGSQALLHTEMVGVWVHGQRRSSCSGKATGEGSVMGGPYVPGKNGDVGFLARRRWRAEQQQQQGQGLDGMRALRCCGPVRKGRASEEGRGGCCGATTTRGRHEGTTAGPTQQS